MPEPLALRLAPPFGKFMRRGTEVRIVQSMQMVLGPAYRNPEGWRKLWASHSEQAALALIELIHLHKLPVGEVRGRITIEGEEHLQASLRSDRGAMLFINHLGNMACAVGGLAIRGYDVTLAGNRIWVPFLEKKLVEIHDRVGAQRVHLGRDMAWTAGKIFRRNGIFATFFDFSVNRRHDAWLGFGRAEMSVSLAPAILAIRNGVDILCASCIRLPGNRHRVVINPPLRVSIEGDARASAAALMGKAVRLLYDDLSKRPEEWWPWDKSHLRLRDRTSDPLSIIRETPEFLPV